MEFGFVMGGKGQVSIEFMLLTVIILAFANGVIIPNIAIAEAASDDVTRVAQARLAVQKVADSIEEVGALGGESRKTINVFVPKDAVLACDAAADTVSVVVTLNEKISIDYAPATTYCSVSGSTVDCTHVILLSADLGGCSGFPVAGKDLVEVKVEKLAGLLTATAT